jgi:hypothetical protein
MSAANLQSVESLVPAGQKQAFRWATSHGMLAFVGLSTYVCSFFLLAIGEFGELSGSLRGFFCAEYALLFPFGKDGRSLLHERPIEYLSLLGSGLINPVFLITFFLQIFRVRQPLLIVVLRTLTILMIPLCWVVFRYEHFHPREGHFLWIAGMLLTLFAMSNQQVYHPKEQHA